MKPLFGFKQLFRNNSLLFYLLCSQKLSALVTKWFLTCETLLYFLIYILRNSFNDIIVFSVHMCGMGMKFPLIATWPGGKTSKSHQLTCRPILHKI